MNTKMQSFHGKQEVKDKYVNRVLMHQKLDNIIQGTGWEGGKGCAVGCTLENYKHDRYPIELGLPLWLAYLEDRIFEGLPEELALSWPSKFLKAIPIGVKEKDFDKVLHKLAILRQKRNLKLQKQLYKQYGEAYQLQVIKAIQKTIQYHKDPTESATRSAAESAWSAAESARSAAESARSAAESAESAWSARSAARSAAESAESAAESAAKSAARSAAESAWSAAESARSAAESARSAESAAYTQESKDLLKLLKQLKGK